MNVPKLRFGEFEDEWQDSTLGDVSKVTSGGTPNRANNEFWNGSIPWVSTALIDFNVIKEADEFITEDGLNNSSAKLFPKNTLLMAMYGQGKTRGKVAILGIEAATNQACAAIMFNEEVDTNFAFHNLSGRYDEIRELSNAGSQENLSAGLIKELNLSYPQITEQQKIADFLSAVDEKITALTAQKTALTQYKQGMMQRIFAQTLRFKDDNGADYPDWKIQPIGGYLIEYKEQSVKHGEFEVLTSSNRGLIRQRDYYGENRLTERDNEGFNVIPHGYITYRSRSDNSKFTFNLNLLGITGVISVYYPVFSIHNGDNRFWVEYLNFHWKDISIYSVGTSQKVLALSALRSIKMSLPTKNEQTKIAQFLTELDDKINAVDAQIQSAQQWKQGLLQQMFV